MSSHPIHPPTASNPQQTRLKIYLSTVFMIKPKLLNSASQALQKLVHMSSPASSQTMLAHSQSWPQWTTIFRCPHIPPLCWSSAYNSFCLICSFLLLCQIDLLVKLLFQRCQCPMFWINLQGILFEVPRDRLVLMNPLLWPNWLQWYFLHNCYETWLYSKYFFGSVFGGIQ